MSYIGAVVVIPTRNRAEIAVNAIRSVLDQPVENMKVLVSDNSTSETDREALFAFCATLSDDRLRYVRPPQPMAIPNHWDWVIEQALARYDASHFTFLSDRMMFRKGALKELLDLAALYPNKIITYNHDRICDDTRPIRIEQYPATEKLLEVETLHMSRLFSQAYLHHGLPRMLNCLVPRGVFERVRHRFGNIFSSIAPDLNFSVRCLEMEESILFFDKSPLFHYALNRSTGASASRGEVTEDFADFMGNLPVNDAKWFYATPIPSLITCVNSAFNEYLILKNETKSPRFFDLDLQRYLRLNSVEIDGVRDPKLRAEMMALLVEQGYEPADASTVPRSWRQRLSFGSVLRKLKHICKEIISRVSRKPEEAGFEFWELDEAINYARNISRGNLVRNSFSVELLEGRELPRNGFRA